MRVLGGFLAMLYMGIGLTFFVIGFMLQCAPASSMMKYIMTYTNQLNDLFAAADAQFNPFNFVDALPRITGNIAAAFIAMGAVQTILGAIGMVALCDGRRRPILTFFFVVISVLVVLQVALIVLYYALRVPIIASAKNTIQYAINNNYNGHNSTNMETILINVIQVSQSCCGINSGQDFESSTSWSRAVRYRNTLYNPVARPLTCCNVKNYTACLMSNHTAYSNQDKGCWTSMEGTVQNNIIYAALGTGALIVLEVLMLAFAASLCYTGRMKPELLEMDQPYM